MALKGLAKILMALRELAHDKIYSERRLGFLSRPHEYDGLFLNLDLLFRDYTAVFFFFFSSLFFHGVEVYLLLVHP